MTREPGSIPEHVRERAGKIRLAAFDVDGTLTDGRLWFDHAGNEMKAYHVQDGLGLRLLEALATKAAEGVEVCFLFDGFGSSAMTSRGA